MWFLRETKERLVSLCSSSSKYRMLRVVKGVKRKEGGDEPPFVRSKPLTRTRTSK